MIELLTIGDELLCGRTRDANAAMLARELYAAGLPVGRVTTVGDDPAGIAAALRSCLPDTRFVIATGGLGPTEDDRTAAAAAAAFNDTLAEHPLALCMLEDTLAKRRLVLNASRRKQAMLPSACSPIANPVGTACGFTLRFEGRHYIFLPGVPDEARAMTEQFVTAYINRHAGHRHTIISWTLRVFGISESYIQESLTAAPPLPEGVRLGFYPHFPEIALRLTASGPDEDEVRERLQQARDAIADSIGEYIYAEGDVSLVETVAGLLAGRSASLSVAESCTGGLLCHLITGVPGSSNWFERGLIVYSNAAKTQLAGVDESIIKRHGAVSEQTARALAEGVCARSETTHALAITGIAGPGGGTPEKPVGTVFFAVAAPDGCSIHQRRFSGTREQIKLLSACTALDLLRRRLSGMPTHP